MGKRIENRTWHPPSFLIGNRFAIHGGRGDLSAPDLREVRLTMDGLIAKHGTPSYRVDGDLKLKDVILSGIVATAVLDRVVEFAGSDDIVQQDSWFDTIPGNFGWILRDVIVLPEPIPCKGAQGLWTVPADVLKELNCVAA